MRSPSLRRVQIHRLDETESFTTLDGSQIRELAGPSSGSALNQSLAEATVAPGEATDEHYHEVTEEIYFFTHGTGRMRLGEEEHEVGPGDAVVIAAGVKHKVWASEDEPLRLLCCCAPAYSHEDTVITEWAATP